MNIYLVQEDGEGVCVRAETMVDAINICEDLYIADLKAEGGEINENLDRKYYANEILQGCSLVGVLKN